MTIEGQADFTKDFLNRVANVVDDHGKGFFWWEPAWIPVPGSGWATPASLKYMNDPGPCGNEWANQALFDYDGNVLPALDVIKNFKNKIITYVILLHDLICYVAFSVGCIAM